jgi:hypothetical protein
MSFRSASGAVKPEDAAGRGGVGRPQPQRARQQPPKRRRVKTVYVAAAATVIVAAIAAAALLHSGTSNSPPPQVSAQQRAAARYNADAVSWVVSQVSRDTTVSCDQAMCAALVKAGFPQTQVQALMLGASSGTPLSSQIVVETPDVRRFFGTSLATAYAPTILTVEGSGPEAVVIGVVAARGAGADQ